MMDLIRLSFKVEVVDVVDWRMWEFQNGCEIVRARLDNSISGGVVGDEWGTGFFLSPSSIIARYSI